MTAFCADVPVNDGQPSLGVSLPEPRGLVLGLGKERVTLELEQVQTFILTLQAAEVQMRSWRPSSHRWP